MPDDTPVSPLNILASFDAAMQAAKEHELNKVAATLGTTEVDASKLVLRSPVEPDDIEAKYAESEEELREAVNLILGDSDTQLGTVGDLQATAAQGDILHVKRRAMSLRYASRSRRLIHTAMRRQAHGVDGGFIDRRLVSTVVNRLKEGKQ